MAKLLPSCLELAGLGLIPSDIREEATRLYASLSALPEYIRRRRLRELVNSAFAKSTRTEELETAALVEPEEE